MDEHSEQGQEGTRAQPCAHAQDSEFLGIYRKGKLWYTQAASIGGSSHHVGPFDTDVAAAIYHDVLATRLHGFSDELNYPEIT